MAGDGSPSSMPTSCSSGSASVSLLASDEEGLMGSSFSFSTSAPVGEGWLSPPEQGRGCSHRPWAGGEGRHRTCFEEQLGERGGAQAGRQVQGGVPSEGPAVDVCSQLWRKARGHEDGPPGPASLSLCPPAARRRPPTFFTRCVAMLRFSISTARCSGVLPPCISVAFTSAPFLTSRSRQAGLFAFTARCTGRRPGAGGEAQHPTSHTRPCPHPGPSSPGPAHRRSWAGAAGRGQLLPGGPAASSPSLRRPCGAPGAAGNCRSGPARWGLHGLAAGAAPPGAAW